MSLRQIIAVVVSLLILGLFVVLSRQVSQREEPKKKEIPVAVKQVEVLPVRNQAVQTRIPLYGRLIAFEKTELFAEVSGMLQGKGKAFRPGMRFSQGELLLDIEDSEPQLSVKAQRAALLSALTQILPDMKIDFPESLEAWERYRREFKLDAPLKALPEPKTERERDYVALKNIYNQYYSILSAEDRLRKYKIYAPFSGEITESLINTGSYIRAGQKLGTLMNTGTYEMEASVAQKDLQYVRLGQAVRLQSEDYGDKSWQGRISRISSSIEPRTQTVKVFIQVSGEQLRENMYLSGYIEANVVAEVMEVPRTLLVDNSQVFYVKDSVLALHPAQVVKISESTVVLRGLPEGLPLLKVNFPGAFEGMRVNAMPLAQSSRE